MQSNPPWQRNSISNAIQGIPAGPGQLGGIAGSGLPFHQGSQMFQQQSQPNLPFGQSAVLNSSNAMNSQLSNNQMFQQGGGAGVSYPQSRTGLNPVAFQSGLQSGSSLQQSGNMNVLVQNRQNFNSIGTVTKITNECGLVNDEVFFYRNACKGMVPKLGDRVVFEATFSQNSQFKWNANRIQLVPQSPMSGGHSNAATMNQPPPLMSQNSGYNAVPPPNEYQRGGNHQRRSPVRRSSPHSDRHSKRDRRETNQRSRDRDEDEHERKRRRDDRERSSRERNRGRDREHEVVKRERDLSLDRRDRDRERGRSPMRRPSQKGPRTRSIPRYKVQIPKTALTFKCADVHELHQRYSTLYIPSDFFHAEVKWSESFPPSNPFSTERPCSFHIMHKVVESLTTDDKAVVDPEDADYAFSAKVMLMSCPAMSDMYQKCFEEDENGSDHNYVHPSRLISFLVGTRGRNEPMAIGGAWSQSLDGPNPETDPSVLIRTAIRTCKALTGIDLSNCTQWFRFLELYYHRDYATKGKFTSPRVETVVIYLPDINSCLPTRTEWESLTQNYKTAVENILHRNSTTPINTTPAVVKMSPECSSPLANACDTISQPSANSQNGNEKDSNKLEPTHYTNLDPKVMKIQDIRDELIARNLSSKGLKPQVTARLIKALTNEKLIEEKKLVEDAKEVEEQADEINIASTDTKNDLEEQIEKYENGEGENPEGDLKNDMATCQDDGDNDADIEVDMSDILILDEYDSRKNDDVKEMDEKEKTQLRRRYTLPDNPHIIVHPSKTAKGGKFDCSVMSLSVLLDYRPEDNKERLFEVSLFAELFNEMLMRDFGFNIFKELYVFKESVTATEQEVEELLKKDEMKSPDDDDKSKDSSSIRDIDQQQLSSNDRKQSDVSDKPKSDQHERRPHKRGFDDEPAEDDSHSVVSTDRKRKLQTEKKPIVTKPHLLLSFVYFDTSHCGYIFEKDLEDLFSILGLHLSRGQIRKILAKSISRHALYYRKLTDKDERLDGQEENEGNLSDEELKRIALGNTTFFPIFKNDGDSIRTGDVKTFDTTSNQCDNEGMVIYQGSVVHVRQLVSQMKRSEKAHAELEKLYNDLRSQHVDLQNQNTKASNKIKDLQTEIKGLNRKLSDTDKDLFLLNRKFNDQYNTLSYVYDKIAPIFGRSSEKGHKSSSEGARDKDKEKEKNKEKEREREKAKENSDTEDDKNKKNPDEDFKTS